MLGVCRGMQLLGVYHGMELFADITHGRIAHTPHRQDITLRNHEPSHAVRLLEKYKDYFNPDVPEERKFFVRESFKYDTDLIWVNSYHHQAIKYYGAKDQGRKWATDALSVIGIAATGVKDCEQIVELMCGKTAPWIGAQFHPEIDYNTNTPSRKVLERFGSFMDKYIETKVSVKK
jgi:gamma-glutamyl-gamma-aminobutyrate hydrolase PuuD